MDQYKGDGTPPYEWEVTIPFGIEQLYGQFNSQVGRATGPISAFRSNG